MKKLAGTVVLGIVLAVGPSSCAELGKLLANPTVDAAIQAAIDVGVGLLAAKGGNTALIASEATVLANLAAGNTATVATLQTQADAVVAASTLSVADKAAFETLIAGIVPLLTSGTQALSPTASESLQLVFTDIANAANLYSSPAAAALRAAH